MEELRSPKVSLQSRTARRAVCAAIPVMSLKGREKHLFRYRKNRKRMILRWKTVSMIWRRNCPPVLQKRQRGTQPHRREP